MSATSIKTIGTCRALAVTTSLGRRGTNNEDTVCIAIKLRTLAINIGLKFKLFTNLVIVKNNTRCQ